MNPQDKFRKSVRSIHKGFLVVFSLLGIITCFLFYTMLDPTFLNGHSNSVTDFAAIEEVDEDLIENGVHVRTGLVDAEGLMEVVTNCTNCHSAKLIIQNRMNKERWEATIDWMQETQNLWDLGENESVIVNYLVTNYPPQKKGRRQNLTNIDWYELEN